MSARIDYSTVTEQWDMLMPPEQIDMLRCRYRLAVDYSRDLDFLEIGCGTGIGLDYVAAFARSAVGGDLTFANLSSARARVSRLPVAQMEAHALPFVAGTFDVVAMFEVIYYLRDVPRTLFECARVLRRGGVLLLCMPNPDRPGFHESPFSVNYLRAPEMVGLLQEAGFTAMVFAGFPVSAAGFRERVLVRLTGMAKKMHLIPTSLTGRARVKRLVLARMEPMRTLRNVPARALSLVRRDVHEVGKDYRILYFVAEHGSG